MTSPTSHVEAMDRQVEAEFVEEMRDILNGIEVLIGNLRSHASPGGEGIERIRREMINIAARSATVEQPLVTIIAHRLSEYLGDVTEVNARRLDEILVFIDQFRVALDGTAESAVTDGAKLVRALPARHTNEFNPKDVTTTTIEILVIIPDKAMSRIVERELHACGYRVTNVRSPFQALEMIIRTRPDMVIVSAVLSELSGIDIATALAAMPSTRHLPVAILTSYSWGHPSLADLPSRVPIIRKGTNFGEDLAEALSRLRIT